MILFVYPVCSHTILLLHEEENQGKGGLGEKRCAFLSVSHVVRVRRVRHSAGLAQAMSLECVERKSACEMKRAEKARGVCRQPGARAAGPLPRGTSRAGGACADAYAGRARRRRGRGRRDAARGHLRRVWCASQPTSAG